MNNGVVKPTHPTDRILGYTNKFGFAPGELMAFNGLTAQALAKRGIELVH